MYRLGIIEESADDGNILSDLFPYFVSQRIENVPEDEITNVVDMLKMRIKETWDEMIEYGVKEANVDRGYLETIPLHI